MKVFLQTTMPRDANGAELEEGVAVMVADKPGLIVAAYPALEDGSDVTVQYEDGTYHAMPGRRCMVTGVPRAALN